MSTGRVCGQVDGFWQLWHSTPLNESNIHEDLTMDLVQSYGKLYYCGELKPSHAFLRDATSKDYNKDPSTLI